MSDALTYITHCNHCGKTFTARGLSTTDAMPRGQDMEYLVALREHVLKCHKQAARDALMAGAEVQGLTFMLSYRTEDPGFRAQVETVRQRIHRRTRKRHVSDETLRMKAAELCDLVELIDRGQRGEVLRVLTEMRNILEELPPFGPADSPEIATVPTVGAETR